ncbi:unnamed protein product [Protopolystoma xenopodis]|uniref:Uncharacterized protein n=1 Tax=Protopolystoma xenopodis TaxID=117903 RepID=A0A3S5BVY9_9PLAT|nr:unnamed protein product [Protopolystoma xenopodis]
MGRVQYRNLSSRLVDINFKVATDRATKLYTLTADHEDKNSRVLSLGVLPVWQPG